MKLNANTPDRWKKSGLRTYDGKWAEEYDSCFYWKIIPADKWDMAVIKQVEIPLKEARILDVGCATGRLLEAMIRKGAVNLCGVDIAPKIVDTARRRIAKYDVKADLRPADVEEHLPWPDQSFDVVTLTGVLHHLTQPQKALSEIYRVLKPGGQLVILELRFIFPVRQICNLFLQIFPMNGDYRFYTPKGTVSLLRQCRFKIRPGKKTPWYTFAVCGVK